MIGNLHPVAETATVAIASVAAAASAAAAAAAVAVAVRITLWYAGMNAQWCMLKVIVYLTVGIQWVMYNVSVQKTTADRHSQHLLLVWSMQ